MTGCIYKPTIYFADTGHEYNIPLNPNIREYIETTGENYPEPDYSLYTLDITDETIQQLYKLIETKDEKNMIDEIKRQKIEYINIEPHIYFIG